MFDGFVTVCLLVVLFVLLLDWCFVGWLVWIGFVSFSLLVVHLMFWFGFT